MSVYNSANKGAIFADVRKDMVSSLTTFKETLEAAGVIPNITMAVDNHDQTLAATPYATVGVTEAAFESLGKGTNYDVLVKIRVQVFLHFVSIGGQYEERMRWDLLNSIFNYYKDTSTISTNFDALFILDTQDNVTFPATNTNGAIFNMEIWKVVQ